MKSQSIVFVLALSSALTQVPVLDLTIPSESTLPTPAATSGVVGGIVGGFAGTLPIAISIVELEDRFYAVGELFEFEVELRNTHDASITIPWSSDRNLVTATPDGTNLLEAALSLRIQDHEGRQRTATSVGIFGAAAHPLTTKVLMPNETVRIRALGRWEVLGIESYSIFGSLPAPLQVRASFRLFYGAVQPTTRDSAPKRITLAAP